MLLRIFIKRKTHGELCNSMTPDDIKNQTVVEEFHEASEIRKIVNKDGYLFKMNGRSGEMWNAQCNVCVMGFELQNDKGVIVDRFVTPVNEEEIRKFYNLS